MNNANLKWNIESLCTFILDSGKSRQFNDKTVWIFMNNSTFYKESWPQILFYMKKLTSEYG